MKRVAITTEGYRHIFECIKDSIKDEWPEEEEAIHAASVIFMRLLTGDAGEKQDIIDEYELDCCRVCEICGELITEGYLLDCSDICSDECGAKFYNINFKNASCTPEDFARIMAEMDDDSDWYYTEWY